MHLHRPLFFFDLETTGLDTEKDRVIEFAGIKVHPDKRQERFETFINPERPIPIEITDLTGITNEMVRDAPTFRDLTSTLIALLKDADLAGHNVHNFDIPMLEAEFRRVGLSMPVPDGRAVLDTLEILKKYEVRTLGWAYRFYMGEERQDFHRSMEDTEAALAILRAQIIKYEMKGTPSELQIEIRYPFLDSRNRLKKEGDHIMINFGKYRGKALAYVKKTDPDYVDWMRENLGQEVSDILSDY